MSLPGLTARTRSRPRRYGARQEGGQRDEAAADEARIEAVLARRFGGNIVPNSFQAHKMGQEESAQK
jgi:hypothetical protein